MTTIVFCVEEPSAREMLTGLLPRVLPDGVAVGYMVFEGKQHLEKELVRRVRSWRLADTRFVVLRDQDSADCHSVKTRLLHLCRQAGRPESLVRVACRELESFFLGDLAAVEAGLEIRGLARKQNSRKYRDPDLLGNPVQELKRVTHGRYQKISGSRAIGAYLRLEGNRSNSFRVLVAGIKRFMENG